MPVIKDVVDQPGLFHIAAQDTVAAAVRRMAELHVGAILVLADGELQGIFSERDLLKRVVAAGRDPETTPIAEVMTTGVSTIDETATLEQAMEAMQAHACRHLPVTRDGRVVAFLSMRDLMNFDLARKTEELQHMRAYINGAA
ncbi:MAG TPA: CBS domain-containing protein [Candidatus Limnocylindrales bacterium]|nr:CBS domain-containing protein [Candidatus Limnocylindrales bacterium]